MPEALGTTTKGTSLEEKSAVGEPGVETGSVLPEDSSEVGGCTGVNGNPIDDEVQDHHSLLVDTEEKAGNGAANDDCQGDSESLNDRNSSGNQKHSEEDSRDTNSGDSQEGEVETEIADVEIKFPGSKTESQGGSPLVEWVDPGSNGLQIEEDGIENCGSGGSLEGLSEKARNSTGNSVDLNNSDNSFGVGISEGTTVGSPCPAPRPSLELNKSKIASVDDVPVIIPPVNNIENRTETFASEEKSEQITEQAEGDSLSSHSCGHSCLPSLPNNLPTSTADSDVPSNLPEVVEEDTGTHSLPPEEIQHLSQVTEESDSETEMGKKSGSFSKRNSGLYLYSKDEFRESYQTKPKPKPARRFTWSHKERGEEKPPPGKKEERIYDSPPFGPPDLSSDEGTSPGNPRSPERTSSPPGSPSPTSSHPCVTVELLSPGETSSPLPSSAAGIDHSFVVSADAEVSQQESEHDLPRPTLPKVLPPLPEEGKVDINSNVETETMAKTKPIPTPRRSLSSSSNTSVPLVARQESLGDDEVMDGHQMEAAGTAAVSFHSVPNSEEMTFKRESVASQEAIPRLESSVDEPVYAIPQKTVDTSSPDVTGPRTPPQSPKLSDILCITRTVDGEEELILGAAPMFANQEKLAMESAAPQQDGDGGSLGSGSGNALADTAKGYKNYAYIEPVDQPVESYRAESGGEVGSPGTVEGTSTGGREREDVQENGGQVTIPDDVNVPGTYHPRHVTVNGGTPGRPGVTASLATSQLQSGSTEENNADDDDDDGGVDDAAYRLSDWMYLGTKQELSVVNGVVQKGEMTNAEMAVDSKESSGLRPASSIDSLETTSSEREFKDQFSSMSLRKIKRDGSTLGYRKLTDITREREMVINYDESVKSFGFRIQYSKPAIVTEVDSGGAAEKTGLLVGDVVLSVNGTDVRKAPHATVVKLVQSGGKELHLLVGTNMCNSPNRDLYKPIKTGYMHKLGGQGVLKNWKRRWFVLKHDGCLYYYKTENEIDPLGAVVLTNYTLLRARDAGKQHCFKITKYKARTYYFYADTETEMNCWAKAITEAAQKKTNSDVWLDISTHNVGLPALSIKNPDCRGFLTKQGANFKNWKKRYCVLKDACMYYYTDMKQPRALGIVHFHGYKIQEMELAGKKYGFTLVPPIPELRTYYFIADNETDRKRWVASLAASIGRWIQTNEEEDSSIPELDGEQEMLI